MANQSYITFDQLMASVESDLPKFADNGMINRGTCIKVVRKVNHDLGLKIFREREATIKIKDYKADLPEDFLYLQLALICGNPVQYNLAAGTVWGTHTEEHNVDTDCAVPLKTCLNSECGAYWVTQTYKEKTIKVNSLQPLRLSRASLKFCSDNCVNTNWSGAYELDIQEGQAVANFREGDVYISYLADMIDESNNVLILDHPLLTPFYEYAIKKHLLEQFFLNSDADVERRLHYVDQQLNEARKLAISFVNTVEYTDIQDLFQANRVRFYNSHYKMFESWS